MQNALSIGLRQMLLAPLLGALAGFLVNRAHRGDAGWPMFFEMATGSALFMLLGAILAQFNRTPRAAIGLSAFLRAEQEHYRAARAQYENAMALARDEDLRAEIARTRVQTVRLADAMANLVAHAAKSGRVLAIAPDAEAQARLDALEAAQAQLARRQVELDNKTLREAEEVKTRLLTLSISDSQRARNAAEPDGPQSGRMIELETRIRKLATEIERLSARQPAAIAEGEASKVAGGTGEGARLGFLKAMLEANQTLRRRIQEAA